MVERPVPAPDIHPQRLFPRAHKSALGLAFGLISGLALFAITALHVVTQTRASGLPLYLLANFFAGYKVTWPGAFIGLGWGFAVGFVGGWLLGFVHNFTVGLWLFIIRTKQDLRQTKNFLDHI
jgi:hypothetical protein